MSGEELSVQGHPEPSFISMRNVFIAPQLLSACCNCGLIRDDADLGSHEGRWVAPRVFHKMLWSEPARCFAETHLRSDMLRTNPAHCSAVPSEDWSIAMTRRAGNRVALYQLRQLHRPLHPGQTTNGPYVGSPTGATKVGTSTHRTVARNGTRSHSVRAQ